MPACRSFAVHGEVFLPCNNRWGTDLYHPAGGFDLDPVSVPADRTSGSPVVLADDVFVGVLDPIAGGRFRSNGATLEITPPPGGRLFIREGQEPYQSWHEYNQAVLSELGRTSTPATSFVDAVEYCAWVEQKHAARQLGRAHPASVLTEEFVLRYLDRLEAMGFPPGKLTIDHGWSLGSTNGGVGDWEPGEARFGDLSRAAEAIRSAGRIPGLWPALRRVTPASRFARDHPNLVGPAVPDVPDTWYLRPRVELAEYYRTIAARYVGMGFRKFKLDLHYGPKQLMRDQLALCYAAIKQADATAEVEHRIPDIFASRHCDVVRTNDVLIAAEQNWQHLVRTHWAVCDNSSPDRVLNLDHVGGNNAAVTETDYLTHWAMYASQRGYPTLSLLPDHFSPDTVEVIRRGLHHYGSARACKNV